MSEAGDFIKGKSMDFSIRIVNLYKWLCNEKKEYVMSQQMLRCGTSIGANLAEAKSAISRADFVAKVYIALKECNETRYWLELLFRTNYLNEQQYYSINTDAVELGKILTTITKKTHPENK